MKTKLILLFAFFAATGGSAFQKASCFIAAIKGFAMLPYLAEFLAVAGAQWASLGLVLLRCFWLHPSTIFGRVISIVVDSVYPSSERLWFHIAQKVWKAKPSLANRYTSPAVAMKLKIARIKASIFHVFPSSINRRTITLSPSSVTVNDVTSAVPPNKSQWLPRNPSTARHGSEGDFGFLTTPALAQPNRYRWLHSGSIYQFAFLAFFLMLPMAAHSQGIRVPLAVTQQNTVAGVTNVVTIPTTARIAFCSAPANAVPCTNLATTYTDATLGTPCSTSTQIVLDGTNVCVAQLNSQATGGVWVPTGQYAFTVSYGGANFGPYFVTAGSTGTIGGTISINQIATGSGAATLTGSNNFQYLPSSGGLLLTSSNVGPANVTGSAIAISNSGGGLTTYITKGSSGEFCIRNDSLLISSHGQLCWDISGNAILTASGNGPALQMYNNASVAPFGNGSSTFSINNTGGGPHVFAVTAAGGSGSNGYLSFDPFNNLLLIAGTTSGVAGIGVNTTAGTPCNIILPSSSPSAGQSLVSAAPSGGNCSASWSNSPLVASLVTTAAASDNVTIVGMTASGHCSLTPTNATASGLAAVPYVSAKGVGQITVTHSVTANASFDVLCTPY